MRELHLGGGGNCARTDLQVGMACHRGEDFGGTLGTERDFDDGKAAIDQLFGQPHGGVRIIEREDRYHPIAGEDVVHVSS